MEKVILHIHIGFHKTGSTALQFLLHENRNLLVDKGILFPKTGFSKWLTRKGFATSGHNMIVSDANNFFRGVINEMYYYNKSGVDIKNVLISAENLIHPFSCKGFYRLLYELNKKKYGDLFSSIRFVVTTREAKSLYESHLKEQFSNESPKLILPPRIFFERKSKTIEKLKNIVPSDQLYILAPGDIFEKIDSYLNLNGYLKSISSNSDVKSYSSSNIPLKDKDILEKFWKGKVTENKRSDLFFYMDSKLNLMKFRLDYLDYSIPFFAYIKMKFILFYLDSRERFSEIFYKCFR